ncbi:MAG: GDP-mannose 4,6-dehydratase, partial [Planctomycetota bacterium]
KAGRQDALYLGNLDAKRDWGYAPEYVEAMRLTLRQDAADDYVVGTGETHTVREFLEEAFGYVDLDYRDYVHTDPRYYRPTEVRHLQADAARARARLNWTPKVHFRDLVRIMMDADLQLAGLEAPGDGRAVVEQQFGGWHRWADQGISMEDYDNG